MKIYSKRMEKHLSKFADNLEELAENTAGYIRVLEEQNRMLREEKNYLLHKAGENVAEIAKLKHDKNSLVLALRDISMNNPNSSVAEYAKLFIDVYSTQGE